MKAPLLNIFRNILKIPVSLKTLNRKIIHFPDDIMQPMQIAVYSGPADSDVWPALYLVNSLQKVFKDIDISVICRERDTELFNMLQWKPRVHSYLDRPEIPDLLDDETFSDSTMLFYPYTGIDAKAESVLRNSGAGIRIAALKTSSPYINLGVKTESDVYPNHLYQLCNALKINCDKSWKPVIQQQILERTEKIMAPISGRTLPYIVTSSNAVNILLKHSAEIPLRTVSLSGKSTDFENLEREIRASIIAGASAVATDSEDLWGDACALGVPVIAIDTSDTFIKWNKCFPVSDETEFIEAWSQLLRDGW